MMRRTKAAAQATREKILNAALELLRSERGITCQTLEDIASTAGVTRGAIYWHFKDKQGFMTALWKELKRRPPAPPDDAVLSRIESLEDFELEILRALDHSIREDHYPLLLKLASRCIEFSKEMESISEKRHHDRQYLLKALTEMFTRLKHLGHLRPDLEPAHAALITVAFVSGLVRLWLVDRTAFSMIEMAPILVEYFLSGLKH